MFLVVFPLKNIHKYYCFRKKCEESSLFAEILHFNFRKSIFVPIQYTYSQGGWTLIMPVTRQTTRWIVVQCNAKVPYIYQLRWYFLNFYRFRFIPVVLRRHSVFGQTLTIQYCVTRFMTITFLSILPIFWAIYKNDELFANFVGFDFAREKKSKF